MARLILLLLCGLAGCAPTGIPGGAAAHWELKGGFYWTWTRNFEHGCAAWMAKDSWADVQLLVDSKCEGARERSWLAGRGLSYLSFEDRLTFMGYWPWSDEAYSELMEFDDQGMFRGVRPCPYSLSADQIAEMRIVAREALAESQTEGEKRVLARVAQRLAALRGAKLASSQGGCTDHDASGKEIDAWRGR